ncbi:MAG: hypothetical protein ACI8PZ_003908 [Myxococcota bacterium]
MSRVLTPPLERAGSVQALDRPTTVDLGRLRPLWRHAVFALILFAVSAAHVYVGVGVSQARTDLDRISGSNDRARLLNQRLELEIATRSRTVRMEEVAAHLEMTPGTKVLRLGRGK